MEDSASMTIEFLRARLLSERSVSRTARQRADELAKRVVELEEQLKVVSLQRKKAEKATAEVLAILETNGISDASEAFDSSSDHEECPFESKIAIGSGKEGTSVGRNDEAFSGSEPESFPLSGGSLSWKSSEGSLHSLKQKKYIDSSRRRGCSLSSTGPSPSRVGKSCRQIRRKDTRSAVEELQIDTRVPALQGDEVATSAECFSICSDNRLETSREGSETREEKDLPERPLLGRSENQGLTNGDYNNGHGRETDMERALEHQAQLIGQYEEEEKAQREWEEKFKENNSCTRDSYDLGNQSNAMEDRDDIIKAPVPPCPTGTITSKNPEAKLEALEERSSEESKAHPHNFDMKCQQDQICSIMTAYESPASDFVSMARGEHDQEDSSSNYFPPLHSSDPRSDLNGTHVSQSTHELYGSSSKGESTGSTRELALMPHGGHDKVGSVLDALQQAKLALEHNFNRLPSSVGESSGRAMEPSVSATRTGGRLEIPVGCAQLFRLPTDFQSEATIGADFLGSCSQFSLTNYSAEPSRAKDMEPRSSILADDRFLTVPTFPYSKIGSRVPLRAPGFGPSFDAWMPSSGRFSNPDPDPDLTAGLRSFSKYAYPKHPFNQDLIPSLPFDDGITRSLPSREFGIPHPTPSFYDRTRPHVHK